MPKSTKRKTALAPATNQPAKAPAIKKKASSKQPAAKTPAAAQPDESYTWTVELLQHGKLMESGSVTLLSSQAHFGPVMRVSVWPLDASGKPDPPAWLRTAIYTEDLDELKLRVKLERPTRDEFTQSVGVFVGDIVEGDGEVTTFGLRSLPSSLPDGKAFDARMCAELWRNGTVDISFHTWDNDPEVCELVPLDGKPLLAFIDKELPWASTLKWYESRSYI